MGEYLHSKGVKTKKVKDSMKKDWIIRPYREGDEVKILSLFPSKHGFRTMEWWQWHFKKNPAGEAIIWVAEAEGEIVGHQSWIPKKLKLFSQNVIVGRSGDSRIKAEYRKQGIFTELLLKGPDSAAKKGWSFFIGLPNKNSRPGLIKIGWLDVCKVPKLINVLQPDRVSQVIRKEGGMVIGTAVGTISKLNRLRLPKRVKAISRDDLTIVEEKKFDGSYDDFWKRVSQYLKIAIILSSDYLNWKYRDNPERKYTVYTVRKHNQLLGFTVLGCYQEKYNIGRILEFLVLPEQFDASEMLLAQANNFFNEKGVDIVQCMALNPFLPKTLYKKYGYIKNPIRKANFTIYPLAADLKFNNLTVDDNWLLSFGVSGTA